ncbi:MAG TPA: class I adenylate-forming enzyme family protein [Propionibacteriaceae bacterium]|nr:class I adenylate-forming enzyme family protein [Propionibacteriaceae bacterium]
MIDHEAPLGVMVDGPSANVNLADHLGRKAAEDPEHIAVVAPSPERRTLSWSELDAQVNAVAAGLAAHGLVAGHRVVLLGPNSIEFVVGYLAALRAGLVAVPLDPHRDVTELGALPRDCGAQVVLARNPLDGLNVPTVPLTVAGMQALAGQGAGPVTSPQDPEALAALVLTAGTSGDPKTVMLSHRSLLSHTEQAAALDLIGPSTTVLAMLPLFGVFGLNAVLGSWLRSGARLVIMDGFDTFFDVVRDEEVTNLPVAPALLYRMLQDDRCVTHLGSVTTVVCGGAPLPEDLRVKFTERTGLRVDQGYGLTEAAGGVSATVGGEVLGHGHVGRPLPGVEIRIGTQVDADEPAEVFVRGDNLFSGYWPNGSGGPDANGWFGTGDIGYLSSGELFLVDRAQELITVNGFHVYPAEVEGAIAELAGVELVAVLGRPDPRTGEQVLAFVTGRGLTEAAVADHCAIRLAKFKRPTTIVVVDALPQGTTGQVLKGQLRTLAKEARG